MSDVPAGDAKKGTKLFKGKCAQCHTIEKGGNVKQEPPSVGVMGRTSGSVEGFACSAANKDSGIVRSPAYMFKYSVNRKQYILAPRCLLLASRRKRNVLISLQP